MGVMPVRRLLITMSLPMMISMLVQALYNVVDSMFVSYISEYALTAVGLAFPAQNLMISVGVGTGVGVNALLSKSLGEKNFDAANKAAVNGIFLAFCSWAAFALLGGFFSRTFMALQTDVPEIIAYGDTYLTIIAVASVGMMFQICFERLLQSTGKTIYTMLSQGLGAVINLILDPLLIFGLGPFPAMGIAGAALATILSQFLSFCLLVGGTFRGTNIPLSFRQFRPSLDKYRIILANGLPSFWRQALASLATILLNVAGRNCGGDTVVAAMSIVSRVTMFAGSGIIGFGQGYQPVCGFNYGAGLYGRVREAFHFFFRVALIAALALSILGFLFAPQVVALFRRDDPEVIYIGALALRLQCITFPLMSWLFPASMTLQTIGRSFKATVLAMCRQGLTFVPLILVLPYLWGVFGIQASQPLADILTFAVALPMGLGVLRELRLAQEGAEAQGTA